MQSCKSKKRPKLLFYHHLPTRIWREENSQHAVENNFGYGAGSRYKVSELFAMKLNYEHAVRLPQAKELLGNSTTIYPNLALNPEKSHNVNIGIFGIVNFTPLSNLYYDLTTNTLTEVKYNGESLPASCGSFTDRVAVANGKAYIGTSIDEKIGASRIYVYDVASGSVKEGAKIAAGYYFDRVSVVENK